MEGVKSESVVQSCLTLRTPRTVAHQAPLSTRFSRQEDWSGLPFPSLAGPPDPWIEARSPALQPPGNPVKGVDGNNYHRGISDMKSIYTGKGKDTSMS